MQLTEVRTLLKVLQQTHPFMSAELSIGKIGMRGCRKDNFWRVRNSGPVLQTNLPSSGVWAVPGAASIVSYIWSPRHVETQHVYDLDTKELYECLRVVHIFSDIDECLRLRMMLGHVDSGSIMNARNRQEYATKPAQNRLQFRYRMVLWLQNLYLLNPDSAAWW